LAVVGLGFPAMFALGAAISAFGSVIRARATLLLDILTAIVSKPATVMSGAASDRFKNKLTTEEELSGLLNLALAGLKRLLKNGAFSYSKTTEEIKEDYIRKSSPIAAFVMGCLETDSDAFIVKKELYNVFTEYCRQLSLPTVTQDTFFKNLPQHVNVMDYRPKIENKRYHTFKGIRYALNGVSNVSRVFYILIEKRGDYEGYEIEELNDPSFIKIRIPLDSMDTLDTKPTTCWVCHKLLPKDFKNTTIHDGKTIHLECYKKLKAGASS
jgi:hypothetical protein